MRRGLLLVGFAGAVLAGGCSCGGGQEQVDAGRDVAVDRSPDDRPEPQDRAEPDDGPPDDVTVPPDGPACDPGGGPVSGSLCMIDLDCACPRTCLRLRAAPASGSCWMRCDPSENQAGTGANPACQAAETCRAGAGDTGGCLPVGTLQGTFDVPMYEAPAQPSSPTDLGTAAVTLDVGLVGQMVFESGWGTTATDGTSDVYRVFLLPGSGATADWDKPLVLDFAADASYQPGATYDLAATPAKALVEYHESTRDLQVLVRDVLRAEALAGLIHMTATGTGGRAPATGTITDGRAVEYEAELCSQYTSPCQ
ncbi:MAG: hypothetical protein HY906_19930 [Deltaproteobacteria bacterium]|nr:hypothetical protein [Deltaproteobacteria bacterium]